MEHVSNRQNIEINTNEEGLNEAKSPHRPRPRSMTMLKLEWLAERVRRVERIRKQVEAGTYHVDSSLVAKAVLGIED